MSPLPWGEFFVMLLQGAVAIFSFFLVIFLIAVVGSRLADKWID